MAWRAGAYPADLRERVLVAGEAVSAVARRFAVGRSTVQDWVRAWCQDGRREAGRMSGHRKPVIAGKAEAALRRMLEGATHLTLAGCRDRLAEEAGMSVHLVTVHRALARMKWSWKAHAARGRAGP